MVARRRLRTCGSQRLSCRCGLDSPAHHLPAKAARNSGTASSKHPARASGLQSSPAPKLCRRNGSNVKNYASPFLLLNHQNNFPSQSCRCWNPEHLCRDKVFAKRGVRVCKTRCGSLGGVIFWSCLQAPDAADSSRGFVEDLMWIPEPSRKVKWAQGIESYTQWSTRRAPLGTRKLCKASFWGPGPLSQNLRSRLRINFRFCFEIVHSDLW